MRHPSVITFLLSLFFCVSASPYLAFVLFKLGAHKMGLYTPSYSFHVFRSVFTATPPLISSLRISSIGGFPLNGCFLFLWLFPICTVVFPFTASVSIYDYFLDLKAV